MVPVANLEDTRCVFEVPVEVWGGSRFGSGTIHSKSGGYQHRVLDVPTACFGVSAEGLEASATGLGGYPAALEGRSTRSVFQGSSQGASMGTPDGFSGSPPHSTSLVSRRTHQICGATMNSFRGCMRRSSK